MKSLYGAVLLTMIVTVSLSLLRQHAAVRFAESTRVDPRAAGEPP